MEWLELGRWSPYAVGAGIGVLSWITFLLLDKPIGCSTAFARTSGMIEKLFKGNRVSEKPYYREFVPEIDWEWMLVAGVFAGAFLSSILSGTFHISMEHAVWTEYFGHTPVLRLIFALAGGVAMGFGSRWAGGCTSGHGISGTLQWALSSWIAALCFFAGGIATAMLVFGVVAGGGIP